MRLLLLALICLPVFAIGQLDTVDFNGKLFFVGYDTVYFENGSIESIIYHDFVKGSPDNMFSGSEVTKYELLLLESRDTIKLKYYDSINNKYFEKEWFSNGQLLRSVEYDSNFFAIGQVNEFYESGKLKSLRYFNRNNGARYPSVTISAGPQLLSNAFKYLEGKSLGWYPDEKLNYVFNHKNGVKHGWQKSWFNDGSKKSEVEYSFGKKVNADIKYYASGTIKEVGEFKNGIPINTLKKYNKVGNLKETVVYENGKEKLNTIYFENGSVKRITELDGIHPGGCAAHVHVKGWRKEFNPNGTIKSGSYYANDTTIFVINCTVDTMQNELGQYVVNGFSVDYLIGDQYHSELFFLDKKRRGGYTVKDPMGETKYEEQPKKFFNELRKEFYPNCEFNTTIFEQWDVSPRKLKY